MAGKLKVLFLCTGNSCRSQMAEGFARHLKEDIMDAYSAGLEAHGLADFLRKSSTCNVFRISNIEQGIMNVEGG